MSSRPRSNGGAFTLYPLGKAGMHPPRLPLLDASGLGLATREVCEQPGHREGARRCSLRSRVLGCRASSSALPQGPLPGRLWVLARRVRLHGAAVRPPARGPASGSERQGGSQHPSSPPGLVQLPLMPARPPARVCPSSHDPTGSRVYNAPLPHDVVLLLQ